MHRQLSSSPITIVVILIAFFISISSSSSSSSSSWTSLSHFFVSAQDADANIMINVLDETSMPNAWRTQNLADWRQSNNRGCNIVTGAYECNFWLIGTLSSSRPLQKLSRPLRQFRIYSNGSLRGSFDWNALKTHFETELEDLRFDQVRLPGAPTFDPANLPSTLTHLEMDRTYAGTDYKDWTKLPPNLVWANLPQNNFEGGLDFRMLPRTLRTLNVQRNDLSGSIDVSDFPPNLVTVNTWDNKKLRGNFEISRLPSSMESVNIGKHANLRGAIDFSTFATRPSNLKTFHVTETGVGGNIELSGLNTITTLRSFNIEQNAFTGPFETRLLPCNALTSLKLDNNDFTGDFDLRSTCMDSVEDLHIHKNRFSALQLPVPQRNTMNLTEVYAHSNNICCFLNAALWPLNKLTYLHLGHNKYSELINGDFFPDTLRSLFIHDMEPPMIGQINARTLPRSLIRVYFHENDLTGSIGTLSELPRNLEDIRANSNNFAPQTIAWKNSPSRLEEFHYSTNKFNAMTDFPLEMSRVLKFCWLGYCEIAGNISFDGLPRTLEGISLQHNRLSGDVAILKLPSKLETFRINDNLFRSSTYLIDLNHLPDGLTTFDMTNNRLTAESRVHHYNLPAKWDMNFDTHLQFCKQVLPGNYIREMLLCNVTMTLTKSLQSLSKTRSSSKSPPETRSSSVTLSKSTSRTESPSLTRSSIDPYRDYMLNVVLYGIKNKPEHWYWMPLRDWKCRRQLPDGSFEEYLCCPRNKTSLLHSCHFENLDAGESRIYFPAIYPLESFAIIKSPNVTGEFRMSELPDPMTSIRLENTKIETILPLWFDKLPRGMVNISLCDNNFVLDDVLFAGTPPTVKTIRLCGGRITNDRNFRGLPKDMELLDLSRQDFWGAVPWHKLPEGIKHVNLAGNRFEGPIAFDLLPPSLISLNVSHNKFVATPAFNSTMHPNLRIVDVSSNPALRGRPNFSNLGRGLRELWASGNNFDGELLSVANVPPNLQRLVLKNNKYIGNFDILDGSLPPHLLDNIRQFCADILPGNFFWESRTCDWTHSHSMSESLSDSHVPSTSKTHSPSSAESFSHDLTSSNDITLTPSLALTESDVNVSMTPTLSIRTPSLDGITATETETISAHSPSESNSSTESDALPDEYWSREPITKNFMWAGAVAAVIATPSIPGAAAIVSRQTAISRAYGGKNGTCGCPTREDPLPPFEDPLQLDLAPEECYGQLTGIFVGNLALSLSIPAGLWVLFALVFMSRYQQVPSFWDAADSGWPIEMLSIFAYALWMPPAISSMLCAAVRCSYGWGGAGAAFCFAVMPFALYYFMFRRKRHERFCRKKYRISRKRESCFRTKKFLQYLFAPVGQWVWKPHLLREAIEKDQQKSKDDEDVEEDLIKKEKSNTSSEDEIKKPSSSAVLNIDDNDDDEDELVALEKEMKKIQEAKRLKVEENSEKPSETQKKTNNDADDDEILVETAPEKDEQEQRFESQYRLQEKYIRPSWWFLCFEYGIRAFMTIGPPAAEAVPSAYSCVTLRAVYLLAVNSLMFAVWSRRPTNHRALFVAIVLATAVETIVLCVLLIDNNYGRILGPWFLGVAQIIATLLLIGIEAYQFVLCRCCAWARGKIVLPRKPSTEDEHDEEDDGKKKESQQQQGLEGMMSTTEEPMLNSSFEAELQRDELDEEGLDLLLGKRPAPKSLFDENTFTTVSTSSPLPSTKKKSVVKKIASPKIIKVGNYCLKNDSSSSSYDGSDNDDNDIFEEDDDEEELQEPTNGQLQMQHLKHETGSSSNNNQDDMFDRLDRRLRRAYVELVHEDDVDVVPKSQNLQEARSDFDKYINL